ncbi:MAG: hypothetical protein WD794_09105 [Mycobacteriales bacterium]
MTADPALGFWLRAAEAEGALHEQGDDAAVVLLPAPLREAFELPEEVTVTADPEVAREDGALLLAQGHPVLDRATERVLARGDVGRLPLAWPAGVPPSAEVLVERLRSQVQVDHGRIDVSGELPVAGYAPVLRVGALVTYSLTLDDRFQERQEVWVDAETGLPLPPTVSAALAAAPTTSGLTHLVLPADRAQAAAAAQVELEQRADERLGALSRQSRGTRDSEVARVADYYRAALDALARRRVAAPADKQALLDARADATRAERERRLAEVEEKFRGTQSIRWYRVHEVLVPTARLPVTIRRGSREYPFVFRWLLPLQMVAPFRCPHCAEPTPLVAGKHRLGCLRCTGQPAAVPVGAPAVPGTATASAVPAQPSPPSPGPSPRATAPRPRPSPTRPARAGGPRPEPVPVFDAKRCADDGNRLALKFWESVVAEDRKLARVVVPGSPAEAALRVWGSFGPALAVGVPATARLTELDAATRADPDAALQVTDGWLRSPQRHYPYSVRWEGASGRPGAVRVAEVVSGQLPGGARLSGHLVRSWWREPRSRPLPASRIALDPVAAALWKVELPGRGPYLLLRCLAAWWRISDRVHVTGGESAVAAALARLLAACAGTQLSYDTVAVQYSVDPADVRARGGELRPLLALDDGHGW